ncbi:hypothetical protein A4D02_28855 [Niastella koreensis]|uniref:carnosine N-methyltransferase n=2 Tax=Niastella koreensis TaxID=354356 RepID=G8T763_NIAKG|nr:methyltransferase domain-containing protein [Niastella koreensis]AEW00088.1 Methyltransferase type 11 [Niastella koreensis GR20-10]OQP49603.1 hypothetical protein A4D02_28855 [Niastella koreensis]
MKDLICVHTKKTLEYITQPLEQLIAPGSTYNYPVIDGIPVLLPNPSLFLAETWYQYSKYVLKQEEAAGKYHNPYQGLAFRKNAADALKKGTLSNMGLIRHAIDGIEKYFSKKQLLNVAVNNKFQDLFQVKAFNYLKRDWCGFPEAEEQLSIIRNSLSAVISEHCHDTQTALVLGAGLGRIAWDISDRFDHLYATDLAFPMASFYNGIAKGKQINFADLNFSQIRDNKHSTNSLTASAAAVGYTETDRAHINDKIAYFLSDATQLPLPDRSVSCILSVYFTDVLPFPQLFPEINRVLKKDGLFIHFGPLGNNFSQVQAMFTAEDIKAYLVKYDYESVYENTAGAWHMKTGEKMHADHYANWVYAARKKEAADPQITAAYLNADSVISLHSNFRFTITGEKSSAGETISHTLYNCYQGKEYKDARQVIDFLFLVNGKRSVRQLAIEYGNQSGDNDSIQSVLTLTQFLVREQILTIVKT